MPQSGDLTHLNDRRGHTHLNQDDDRRGNTHGGNRMQNNAKRTMIGIRLQWVDVRNLNHRQQGQQRQTHQRHHHQLARWCESGAPGWVISDQECLYPVDQEYTDSMQEEQLRFECGYAFSPGRGIEAGQPVGLRLV